MGFMEAVRSVLMHRYADFQGRSPRSEYWWFQLFVILVLVVLAGVFFGLAGGIGSEAMAQVGAIVIGIFYLGILIPSIAVAIRRFHDQDKSGWFILLGLIPYAGGIIILVFMCLKGTEGDNRWGPDPLGNVADRFS